ncbi:MAG: sel1 repeat family protein [Akkermansiaceae bacterium]|nr:sel1 repeat family protein [Verrucomicrobiales bacterium]
MATMDQQSLNRANQGPPQPMAKAAAEASGETPDAQFHLGFQCAGDGPAQDYPRAMEWYFKAAKQNHPLAQFNLGIMYANGQGVTRNDQEAAIWFGKSARLGDAGAQHRLGMNSYHASMDGLPESMGESRIEAYKWFVLSAAKGYSGSETARDAVVLKMSQAEVLEATERVVSFMRTIRGNPES